MNRRLFIKNITMTGALLPLVSSLEHCGIKATRDRRIMVVVQLVGGNDGLSTLIPLDAYKSLHNARPSLIIPENKVLTLKDITNTGLHPSLPGIRDMFDSGHASFIQGVGYPNPSYSHFRSADIYGTAAASSVIQDTGWAARFLEAKYKGYPFAFPNAQNPDPPAIKLGPVATLLFQAKDMVMSLAVDPLTNVYEVSGIDTGATVATGYAADTLRYIRKIYQQEDKYAGRLAHAISTPFAHSRSYPKPGENPLADQMKMVAKLIHGGLETTVYHTNLDGFDTHNNQALAGDATRGAHADLLRKLDQALSCFWEDMTAMNMDGQVNGFVFSEFGRRIAANASLGTDHGSSQPLLFFGAGIPPGILGHNPLLPDHAVTSDNLPMQYDFRSVYASILRHWFRASDTDIAIALPGDFSRGALWGKV